MYVSARQFCGDWRDAFGNVDVPGLPPLPRRATAGSAGYDFFSPLAFTLAPGESLRVPTGVRA
ncbi:MAG: deoxyuridine 5'-triphosphate nucleotidohydrolase, partial [Clostridia bacterium]|nr:deoxyuridine 5'-triphosphate nucleotidohydrolase [Clostridia bacterium]